MGETGMIGLTVTLCVIAFLTDTVLIIASDRISTLSLHHYLVLYKWPLANFFIKKVFLVAPLHHHFEAVLDGPKLKSL
jgi:phospho-N-acetylmuramoyl-pentapeptide-transferase